MKKFAGWLCRIKVKSFRWGLGLLSSAFAVCGWADSGVIPTPPSSEQLGNNNDYLGIIAGVFKSELAPLIIYGLTTLLVAAGISEIMKGVKKARDKDDWHEMKSSVIAAAVMVTIGMSLGYVGHSIFSNINITPGT